MADLSDMQRLRAQNLSLLQELQKGQQSLRQAVQSTAVTRGSPFEKPQPTNADRQRGGLRAQREPRSSRTGVPAPGKGERRELRTVRLTSTPKPAGSDLGPLSPRPTVAPSLTGVPDSLCASFLAESQSAFGRGRRERSSSPSLPERTRRKKTRPQSAGVVSAAKKAGQSPKTRRRPGTIAPAFTPSPDRGVRPRSARLEMSSLLPSEKENQGRGSRYGHRPPLDLAHEESYYRLNGNSPLAAGAPGQGPGFAGRLLADGNSRPAAGARPKSILLTPGARLNKSRNRVSFHESPQVTTTTVSNDDGMANRIQPLLGYDWIAGLLDADSPSNQHSDLFFEELRQFRQANREECVHKALTENPNISASFQEQGRSVEEDQGATESGKHTCIHNYTLNSRLFAVPLHGSGHGESLCAICNDRRQAKQSGTASPSYIRVSIPRSTLASPYRLRPHRRKSFDPTDSVGLSQHCLAGWETSKPSMLPTASNIDLRDSVDVMASNTLNLMSYPDGEPPHPAATGATSRLSRHTQDLLKRSQALRLDLQRLERVGVAVARPSSPAPNSTAYLLL